MSPRFRLSPRWMNFFRNSTVLLVATSLVILTSVFVIVDKVSSATSSTTIVTCVNKKTGLMRLLTKGSCNTKTETVLKWARLGPENEDGEIGPTGPTGPTGPIGPSGPTGAQGEQGSQGFQGLVGQRGPSGPQGLAGPGAQGAQGAQGPAGTGGTDSSFGFVPKYICGAAGNSLCSLGSEGPGGGTVVYIDFHNTYANLDYVEIAPIGWNGTSDDPQVPWCDNTTTSVNPTRNAYPRWIGRELGQGVTNMNDILALCSSGAGVLARSYHPTHNGVTYADWNLPVLVSMTQTYVSNFGAGSLEGEIYWTSSEYSATQAWATDFSQFDQPILNKAEAHAVRPARHF